MLASYLLALSVGLLWGIVPVFMVTLVRQYGAFTCNTVRIFTSTILFCALSFIWADWSMLNGDSLSAAIKSGVIGLLLGDFLLYRGLHFLGPRRNSLLFSSHSIFSILLGVLVFQETYALVVWLGAALILLGIYLAILFAPSRSGRTRGPGHLTGDDDIAGHIGLGIGFAIGAALCQSYGMFVVKPYMHSFQDALVVNTIRLLCATALSVPLLWHFKWHTMPVYDFIKITCLGVLAVGLGSFLLHYAMVNGELGLVSLLSSTAPLWVLPLLWWRTGQCPHFYAWLGALLGMLGLACIIFV